jgi:hypothetical protein
MLLQQAAYQPQLQQQGGLIVPAAHIPCAHNKTLVQGLQQQQQQHWGSPPVHALASALLHILLTLVTAVVHMHKGVQAAAARLAALKRRCLQVICQQLQLVSSAAVQAASAEGVEELWLLLQPPSTSSSSSTSNSNSCDSSSSSSSSSAEPVTTTAVMAGRQQLLLQQQAGNTPATTTATHEAGDCLTHQQQQQQQRETASVSGFDQLLVVLGLWAGVVWWVCRWLLLQAPTAAGNAAASTCQQGASAAESAAVLAVEYLLRVCYGVTWAAAKQMHSLASRVAQAAFVHGAAAAQQACCVVLWVIGFANGDSQQQRSQLQQLLVQVLCSAGAALGRCGQWGMASAEVVAAAVAAKLLRDASPVTQVRCWQTQLVISLRPTNGSQDAANSYVSDSVYMPESYACTAGKCGCCCCCGKAAASCLTSGAGAMLQTLWGMHLMSLRLYELQRYQHKHMPAAMHAQQTETLLRGCSSDTSKPAAAAQDSLSC